jgi:hypothetical protein
VGKPLRLAVNPGHFHFFDPATGENLIIAAQAAPNTE